MLNESTITSVMLNKQDSSFNLFGSIDLYVKKENQITALELKKQTT